MGRSFGLISGVYVFYLIGGSILVGKGDISFRNRISPWPNETLAHWDGTYVFRSSL